MELTHTPFTEGGIINEGTSAAIDWVLDFGADVKRHRRLVETSLRRKRKSMQLLDSALKEVMSAETRHIARHQSPAMFLYCCILLAHPDVRLASDLVLGFQIVGRLTDFGVFRQQPPAPSVVSTHDLLANAIAYRRMLAARAKPSADPADDVALRESVEKDVAMGFAGPILEEHQLDAEYGPTGWHCL